METQASSPSRRILRPPGLPAGPAIDYVQPGARPGRSVREFASNATLLKREDLTVSIARFVVRPDAGVAPFKPGQYFALGLSVDGAVL